MRPADPGSRRTAALVRVAFTVALASAGRAAADYALPASRTGGATSAASSASYALGPAQLGGAITPSASADYALAAGFGAQTAIPELHLRAPDGGDELALPAQPVGVSAPAVALDLRLYGNQGTLSLAAPAGYELSLAPDSDFASTLLLPAGSVTPPGTTVYLRISPSAIAGVIGGAITFTGGASPAPAFSVSALLTGPVAVADSVTKATNGAELKIPVSALLANDHRVTAAGELATDGLALVAVASGAGNSATLSGGRVFFIGNPAAASETFTYTLSDGTGSVTGLVTVATAAPAPFTLQLVTVGTAAFDGENTSASYGFIGVPNQLYTLQYTSDLAGSWTTLAPVSTGPTGSFTALVSAPGDHADLWNARIFFRAVRTP